MSASVVVEKFAFSHSVRIMSLHNRYRYNFQLNRLLEVSNCLLFDWLDTSRIRFKKKLSRRDPIPRDPGAVGRDGTKKSRAKSGAARVYELVSVNFWTRAVTDFAWNFFVPSRQLSLSFRGWRDHGAMVRALAFHECGLGSTPDSPPCMGWVELIRYVVSPIGQSAR